MPGEVLAVISTYSPSPYRKWADCCAIKGSWNLRVSKDGELEGLDIHEHGTPAYHVEFGYGMTYSTPANLSGGTPLGGTIPSSVGEEISV